MDHHEHHAGHSVAMFRDRFWLTLALTIPVVRLSHDIQEWFGYSVPMVAGGVLVPWGIDLPMAVGAIAMSASTLIVAANAQLLRRLRLRGKIPRMGPRLATAENADA
jgi:hypothetical protein